MSIKIICAPGKANSFYPKAWNWGEDPFPAYRGEGFRHRGFLPVAKNYIPTLNEAPPSASSYRGGSPSFDVAPSKLIRTKEKQTLLLVPCGEEEDEKILLITLQGGFRGGYSRIKGVGCEILSQPTSGGHCVVTGHLIVRLTKADGFVFAETGRRCSVGLVEIFSWEGYKSMPTEEFEIWRTNYAPE